MESKPAPTMLSSFIRQLNDILARNGDMPVAAVDDRYLSARVHAYVDDFYYDGGYITPTNDGKWLHSRLAGKKQVPWYNFCHIRAFEPEPNIIGEAEDGSILDGKPAPWLGDCPICGEDMWLDRLLLIHDMGVKNSDVILSQQKIDIALSMIDQVLEHSSDEELKERLQKKRAWYAAMKGTL